MTSKRYIIYRIKRERGDVVLVEWWESTNWFVGSVDKHGVKEMKEEVKRLRHQHQDFEFVIMPESGLDTSISVNRVHNIGGVE